MKNFITKNPRKLVHCIIHCNVKNSYHSLEAWALVYMSVISVELKLYQLELPYKTNVLDFIITCDGRFGLYDGFFWVPE